MVKRDSKGRFVKGHKVPEMWRKAHRRLKGKHLSPETEFKKGNKPWNKGNHWSLDTSEENVVELYKKGKTAKEIARMGNCSSTVIYEILAKNRIERRTNKGKRIKPDFSNLTPLSYILGVIMGDGCIDKPYRVILGVTDEEFATSFHNALEEINLRPSKTTGEQEGSYSKGKIQIWKVIASSIEFCNWFESVDKREIIFSNQETALSFFRGIFESDGTAGVYHQTFLISISNTSQKILQLCSDVLAFLGMDCSVGEDYVYVKGTSQEKMEFLNRVNPCIKGGELK